METIRNGYVVSHCYASTKVRENKDGSKSTVVFHVVFEKDLPSGPDVKVKNVISLTEKQVRYVATICRVPANLPLNTTIQMLSGIIGNGRTIALVSSEEHKKGAEYVDAAGVKQTYDKDSFANKIDSLKLAKSLTDRVDEKLAEIMCGVYESANPFAEVPGEEEEKPL